MDMQDAEATAILGKRLEIIHSSNSRAAIPNSLISRKLPPDTSGAINGFASFARPLLTKTCVIIPSQN